MVFATYFLKRFIWFVLALTTLLALIFNLIEFFEKLVRVQHTDILSICYFIGLNFLPSFSDLMPIGCWLATCLMVWEFHQNGEWETLFLLTIGSKSLLKLFTLGSVISTIFIVIVHENFIIPLAAHAARFKVEHFRQGDANVITNASYVLHDNTFCSVDSFDLNSSRGRGLLVALFSPLSEVTSVIKASHFYGDPDSQSITLFDGYEYGVGGGKAAAFQQKNIEIPGLLMRVQMTRDEPSLIALTKKVLLYKNVLSREMHNELIQQIISRILFYFKIFIYPLITIFLFLIMERYRYGKWIFLLLPYPIITVLAVFSTFLLHSGVQIGFFIAMTLFSILLVAISGLVVWQKRLSVR